MGEWTRQTLKIWKKIKLSLKLPKTISALNRIGSLSGFMPSILDVGFDKWAEHSLVNVHQLLKEAFLKFFEQLQNEFQLPNADFFQLSTIKEFPH